MIYNKLQSCIKPRCSSGDPLLAELFRKRQALAPKGVHGPYSAGILLTSLFSFLVCLRNLQPSLPSVSKLALHLSGTGLRSVSQ